MKSDRRGKKEEGRVVVWIRLSLKFFFFLIFFFFVPSFVPRPSSFVFASDVGSPKQVCFNDQCLDVEVMDTNETRARGLQGRTSLPVGQGMLFVFPSEDIFNFWMKDTLIPLDMIWINEDRKIIDIKTGVLPCAKDPCPLYTPSAKARFVLEVNADYTQTHGLKVGDEAFFK